MMRYRFFFLSFLFAISLQAANILDLVGLLDRNDMVTFQSRIQTLNDANSAREDNNKTILMYACWIGNTEAVKYLVLKGANVNAQDSGGATALHLAAWKGHVAIALYLLENGASAQTMSKDGMSSLDIALMQGNQEIADAMNKSAPKLKPLL
ncbi:MAG: ankyrin repeat domain-containing protein [Sulfuricurvum sp.]|uniref:ankyrin repeat domain-containing protein n=1 Tax=Sulfuricurvum sp. TaxID=2025608 RepID=UPI00272ABCA8|nr:ankyrin repeat domain-containing protein [Sulfuricurvum sp.]MDP3290486.1 ankyrin repeat domain-containing protein [Sulfuricurvum sp.]